jgi:tetratricopeptide (TPR) repeat protein
MAFRFWVIFWIDCSTNHTIEQGFLKIAQTCKIKEEIESIQTWLANSPEQWLLIFDNADDPLIDISRYFPTGSRGTILVTTRNPDCKVHETVGSYEFAGMGVEDAVALLLKLVGTDDASRDRSRATASGIVTMLDNLALAVSQAGAAVRQKLCRIEDYCDMYRLRRQELLSHAPTQASSDYKYTVYTTWEVSVNSIERMHTQISNRALDLLRVFSFMNFDGISEEIFKQAWKNTRDEPCSDWAASNRLNWLHEDNSSEWDPYLIREPMILLSSFSLINIDGCNNNASLHPLVHSWARDRLGEIERSRWAVITALTLATAVSRRSKVFDYMFRRSLVSHVIHCLNSFNPEILFAVDSGEEERLEMAAKFSNVCFENGLWLRATDIRERVVEARKRKLGEEHPDTLASIDSLARSYNELGRRQEAMELREKVFEARRRILGEEHLDTLLSKGSLARSYNFLGGGQEAIQLGETVVEASKRTLGEEHLDTLESMENLACCYNRLGRRQEAMELREKVFEARKRILEEEHPDTLASMHSLACSYDYLSRRQEAVELGEKVVEASKRILGEEHPDTVFPMNNLAACYSDLGRTQEAVELGEKVVEARKRTLGEDDPDTLFSMDNLTRYYSNLGRRQEAMELGENVIRVRRITLGEEHPATLASMDNLEFYLANLPKPTQSHDFVTRMIIHSEQAVQGKLRRRWNLKSLVKRHHRDREDPQASPATSGTGTYRGNL